MSTRVTKGLGKTDPESHENQDPPSLDNKEIGRVDEELATMQIQPPMGLTLLISKFVGPEFVALFASYEKAVRYLHRVSVNNCIETYQDHPAECDSDGKMISFLDYVKANINEDYELITVTHLNPSQPIYVKQDCFKGVYGLPSEFLTHSIAEWKKNPPRRLGVDQDGDIPSGYTYDEWLQRCTVEMDPPLPNLAVLTQDE